MIDARMNCRFLLVFLLVMALVPARADNDRVKTRAQAETLIATLHFREGTVPLQGNMATVNVPPQMRFLDGPDAAKVVYQLWGNRRGPDPLGDAGAGRLQHAVAGMLGRHYYLRRRRLRAMTTRRKSITTSC